MEIFNSPKYTVRSKEKSAKSDPDNFLKSSDSNNLEKIPYIGSPQIDQNSQIIVNEEDKPNPLDKNLLLPPMPTL